MLHFFKNTLGSLLVLMLLLSSHAGNAQAPVFVIGSASNVATGNIVVPVTTQNFKDILAWQGSINWDNSKLTYVGVSTPVVQLTGMQFSATVNSNTGRLSFLWLDDNLATQTIANNTVLFNISFNVVAGAADSTAIIFANSPTALLLSDGNGTAINDVTYTNGMIGFPRVFIAPVFTLGSAINVNTATVVIPVTTKNFAQILAMQGSVNWDNNKLTYASVSSPVNQLTGIQFNASVNATTGRLSFIWLDNNLQSQTIADNAVLFSITFNVVAGASGNSDILFSNNPASLLISDAAASPVENVVYTNGKVSFAGAVLAPDFQIGSANNVSAASFSLPVTAKNFVKLLAMQGSINWDNTKMTYANVSSPYTQLDGMLFNASVNGQTGALTYLWTDNSLLSQSIPDNTVLFTITFNKLPAASGITDIIFSGTPAALLISNASFEEVSNTVYAKGIVTFSSGICAAGASTSFTSNLTGISYQWQTDAGTGVFADITDNSSYAGIISPTLSLNNLSTAWAGYNYRCVVNGVNSALFKIKFTNYWIGAVSTAWETAANWSCGTVPADYTDVVINAGSPFNPLVNSNVTCRSITGNPSSSLTINPGFSLLISGK